MIVATFAIYKKSKRAKDLILVAFPVDAATEADALVVYLEQRRAAGEPVKDLRWRERLRARPWLMIGGARPPARISHRHHVRPL